ncbi:MAG: L,D-transpeptidase family protein [Thermoanaerobaculia bacterium]|nr:L,D-transpeptidase family protein [Thermoanaerobaculia bacterium]
MSGRRLAPAGLAGVLLALALPLTGASDVGPDVSRLEPVPTPLPERRLVQGLLDTSRGQLTDALGNLDELVRAQPDFQLAHLVRGDLLLALAGRVGEFGAGVPAALAGGFRDEARARLLRYLDSPPPNAVPSGLLRLPDTTPAALAVDLERYRLYVVENRGGRLVRTRDYYVAIGKGGTDKRFEGDEKTPVGVYFVTEYIPGEKLADLYGAGAFPISYPNGWDRALGRTGSGIWIHGTEWALYSRVPLSSRGCVTLANEDFARLRESVTLQQTPVLLAGRLEWASTDDVASDARELTSAIESWRRDWESLDTDRYLDHYSQSFRGRGMSRGEFASHKRRVNAGKRWVRVGISQLGLYAYPGEEGMVVADFRQDYESDGFRSSVRKRQYWRREAGRWRIVLEENV